MGFLRRLLLGNGTLRPGLRRELEAEGLVLVEERLPITLRYHRFRAPGRYHHGKITPEHGALGISARRVVLYCRSGRVKLMDSELDSPRLGAIELSLSSDDKLVVEVDYDKLGERGVSGRIAIHVKTSNAPRIVRELEARVARHRG